MKNIVTTVLLLFWFPMALSAQNLVPNPSFEEGLVPYTWDQLEYAVPWRDPSSATPDYMHEDCTNLTVFRAKIPDNGWGWQYARTGKGYIALHTYTEAFQEIEFAQVTLKDTLKIGREYRVSAWINQGDYSNHSTNCHGFLFTIHEFSDYGFIEMIPQINNFEIIRDTQNWLQIGGEFVPETNYKVLTLGNFYGDTPPFQVQDEFGWTGTATYYWDDISVELINRQVEFDFNIAGTCLPATVYLEGVSFGLNDDLTWTWSDGIAQNGENVQRVFEQSGTYSVTLTITHNGVSYSAVKDIEINLPLAPLAAFEIVETKRGMKKDIHFENLSQHATQWLWDFGDSTFSDEEAPIHAFDTLGNFRILLIASNEVGCADTVSQEVYIACSDRMIFNAFTPNGDGQNEELPFDRLTICGEPINIKIFNRWGNLVFESDDSSTPWRAEDIPSGTYYFIISYRGGKEEGYIDVIK